MASATAAHLQMIAQLTGSNAKLEEELSNRVRQVHQLNHPDQRSTRQQSFIRQIAFLGQKCELDARELLMLALTLGGAEVRVAATVGAALNILDEWRADVLVSDIGMPNEDGYEFIRKVRARKPKRGGRAPALALTGYASIEDNARALRPATKCTWQNPYHPEPVRND